MVMGLAFKENCPDLRNTRVVDIVAELKDYTFKVYVYDPWVSHIESKVEHGISPVEAPLIGAYNELNITVSRMEFSYLGAAELHAIRQAKSNTIELEVCIYKRRSRSQFMRSV